MKINYSIMQMPSINKRDTVFDKIILRWVVPSSITINERCHFFQFLHFRSLFHW